MCFVSIIIPVYRDWEALEHCVSALNSQNCSVENFEVLLVNNEPHHSPPHLDMNCQFRWIHEPKVGSYAARNAGIASARGSVLAFTDADCVPDPQWLSNGVALLNSGYDRVAGRIDVFSRSNRPTLAEHYEFITAFNQRHNAAQGFSVTANLICHRHCFEKVGLFDECFYSGGDFDWGHRASKAGLSIVFGEQVVVRHPALHSVRAVLKKAHRVAGGAHMQRRASRQNWFLLRGWTPPMGLFNVILKRPKLTVRQKIGLCVLAWERQLVMVLSQILMSYGLIDRPRR